LYIHQLKPVQTNFLFLPMTGKTVKQLIQFGTKQAVRFKQVEDGVLVYLDSTKPDPIDTVFEMIF